MFRPAARIENLRRRAELLDRTRRFFREREVLEIETPTLSRGVIVDRHLDPPRCGDFWLQTSPESFLKRFVASGGGACFEICRAYREGERGRLHNPEFTIVEWYRPGFDADVLMDEVADLVEALLGESRGREKVTYQELFLRHAKVDPLEASVDELIAAARAIESGESESLSLPEDLDSITDRDDLLDLILVAAIQPKLGRDSLTFVHDYPASQAALSRLKPEDPGVGERFELYIDGVELCNGYRELLDASEQRARFVEANEQRVADGKSALPIDELFLEALEAGLPDCSGVALGFDRVVMLACGASSIDEVIAFPADRV